MIALIFLLVTIVAGLAFLRPEALSGKRPGDTRAESLSLLGAEGKKLSPAERIAKYQEMIQREVKNHLLINFNVPDGYLQEISTLDKYTFGFCYPKDWTFLKFHEQVRYGAVIEAISADRPNFRRNMNIAIDDIRAFDESLDVYEVTLSQILAHLPNSTLVFKEDFIFQGLHAMRYRVNWRPNDPDAVTVSLYQIVVADKDKQALYAISFTTREDDFDNARKLFDNIASTFRI